MLVSQHVFPQGTCVRFSAVNQLAYLVAVRMFVCIVNMLLFVVEVLSESCLEVQVFRDVEQHIERTKGAVVVDIYIFFVERLYRVVIGKFRSAYGILSVGTVRRIPGTLFDGAGYYARTDIITGRHTVIA